MGLLATGFLALGANTASAIPLQINVTTIGAIAGGEWELTGVTNDSDYWGGILVGIQNWNLDIAPGTYNWNISGEGWLASVSWLVRLDGAAVFSGSEGNFNIFRNGGHFRVNANGGFESAPTEVPEPGVLLLLGGGLLAFATVGRRKAVRA